MYATNLLRSAAAVRLGSSSTPASPVDDDSSRTSVGGKFELSHRHGAGAAAATRCSLPPLVMVPTGSGGAELTQLACSPCMSRRTLTPSTPPLSVTSHGSPTDEGGGGGGGPSTSVVEESSPSPPCTIVAPPNAAITAMAHAPPAAAVIKRLAICE